MGVGDPGVRARGHGGILLAADKPARSRFGMAILGWTYVVVGAWHSVRQDVQNVPVSAHCHLTRKRPLLGRDSLGREQREIPVLVWEWV